MLQYRFSVFIFQSPTIFVFFSVSYTDTSRIPAIPCLLSGGLDRPRMPVGGVPGIRPF
jgi:hypothetical protein